MIVFKNYFKIVKTHLGIIIMFSAIAIGISVANTMSDNHSNFETIKPKLAIMNSDNSQLSSSLIKYLEKNSQIIEVENSKESIQDAKLLLDPKRVEDVYKRNLRNTTIGATLTEEALESLWESNKKSSLEQAKSTADDILKAVKKCKTKWTLIGAGVGALTGAGTGGYE